MKCTKGHGSRAFTANSKFDYQNMKQTTVLLRQELLY